MARGKFAVLQIVGDGVQWGTPGDAQVYSTHRTEQAAIREMGKQMDKHDDAIVVFDLGVLNTETGKYDRVDWTGGDGYPF